MLRVGKSVCFLWPDLEKRNSRYFVARAKVAHPRLRDRPTFPSNLSQSRPPVGAGNERETPTASGGGLSLPKRRG